MLLDGRGQIEQSHEVGDRGAVKTNPLSDLFLLRTELGLKRAERVRLLQRIKVLALEVLDQCKDSRLLVRDFSGNHRHLGQPRQLGGAPAALTRDDLHGSTGATNQNRLEHTALADGLAELREVTGVNAGSRLVGVGHQFVQRNHRQFGARNPGDDFLRRCFWCRNQGDSCLGWLLVHRRGRWRSDLGGWGRRSTTI